MAEGECKGDPAGHESKVADDKATGDAKVGADTLPPLTLANKWTQIGRAVWCL